MNLVKGHKSKLTVNRNAEWSRPVLGFDYANLDSTFTKGKSTGNTQRSCDGCRNLHMWHKSI